jgi:flavin-binding protein dodecin
MRDGQVVGQDQLNYTPAAGKASVRVNKTLDILVLPEVEETQRERGALKDRFNNPTHDLVTLSGKIEVKNLKSRALTLALTLPVEGEAAAPDGTVTRQAEGLKQINPRSLVTWRLPLQPGQGKTLTYSVKVYVGAG